MNRSQRKRIQKRNPSFTEEALLVENSFIEALFDENNKHSYELLYDKHNVAYKMVFDRLSQDKNHKSNSVNRLYFENKYEPLENVV